MPGGFFGTAAVPGGVVLGNLLGKGGFFGPIFVPTVVPQDQLDILIQVGLPSGFSFTLEGWDGLNGVVGPSNIGALVGGHAGGFPLGLQFALGNCGSNDSPAPLPPPFFCVTSSFGLPQNQFVSVKLDIIGAATYNTATADFFTNTGGDGPTMWAWATPIAALFPGGEFFWVFNPPP